MSDADCTPGRESRSVAAIVYFFSSLLGRIAVLQENYWQLSILNREDTILITLSIFLSADCLNQFKMRCRNQWDLVECTLTQPGEYQWTVHMRRRCGLLSN